MASYRIELKRSAAKEIEKISNKEDRQRVARRISELAKEPRPAGCEKLTGRNNYRIRQGDYRIIYTIEDEVLVVTVVKIGHRRDVYR